MYSRVSVPIQLLSFLLLLLYCALCFNGNALASEEMAQLFANKMLTHLKVQSSDCPQDMPDPEPYRLAVCAKLEMKYKKFKRSWNRWAWKCRNRPCYAYALSEWERNEKGFERTYEVDGTPLKVFWSEETGCLIISYFKDLNRCSSDSDPSTLPLVKQSDPATTPPKLIPESKSEPVYPLRARLLKKGGTVIMRAVVKKDGTVEDICFLKIEPSGFGFEFAAFNAVRKWRYQPAVKDGKPVEVYFTVKIDFFICDSPICTHQNMYLF